MAIEDMGTTTLYRPVGPQELAEFNRHIVGGSW